MLMIFNLDWKSCDIDEKVTRASRNLETLIETMGAGHYVQYDLTSLGANETIFWKSTPPEKRVNPEVIDMIRVEHQQIRRDLLQDKAFDASQSMARMLKSLKGDRHKLVAAFPGDKAEAEAHLRRARLREFFDENVYGYDSLRHVTPTLKNLFEYVSDMVSANPFTVGPACNDAQDMLIIDESIGGMNASRDLDVAGLAYISPKKVPADEFTFRLQAMLDAGARGYATSPEDIVMIPYGAVRKRPSEFPEDFSEQHAEHSERDREKRTLVSMTSLPGAISLDHLKPPRP